MTQCVSCGRCATILPCSWSLPGLGPGWPPPASVTCGQLWTTFSDPYCYTRTLSHVQSAGSQSFLFKLSTGLLADMQDASDDWQRFKSPTVYTQTLSGQSCHMSRVQSLNLSSSSSPLVSESIVTILNTRWCCVNLYKRSFLSWTFSFHIYQGTI